MKFLKFPRLVSALLVLGVVQLALVTGCETRLNQPQPPAPADPPDILVTVVDGSGAAMDSAKVILWKTIESGVTKHMTVITGADGKALFENPGAGIYIVYATKTGYLGGVAGWTLSTTDANGPTTVKITAMADLPDLGTGTYTSSTPTIGTIPLDTLLAADSIIVTPPASITITGGATDGTQVSVSNPAVSSIPPIDGQIPLTGIVISGTDSKTNGTVTLGLPFALPVGTSVPLYRYDEATGSWVVVGTGSVGADGSVSGNVNGLYGLISALANFTPTRNQLLETLVDTSNWLDAFETSTYSHAYTPTLNIERADDYSRTERDWIRSVVQGITGLVYGQATLLSADKPEGQAGQFNIWEILDRYTIQVDLGGSRPTRGAAVTTEHHAQSRRRNMLWNTGHFSTTGG